jgi:hypothetical protein
MNWLQKLFHIHKWDYKSRTFPFTVPEREAFGMVLPPVETSLPITFRKCACGKVQRRQTHYPHKWLNDTLDWLTAERLDFKIISSMEIMNPKKTIIYTKKLR